MNNDYPYNNGMDETPTNNGMGSEWIEGEEMSEPEEGEDFEWIPVEEGAPPIEERASEAEKIYANLLMRTDFEREFIEEVLEFEPDEESEMRIDELRQKRREMQQLAQGHVPPQETTTILI